MNFIPNASLQSSNTLALPGRAEYLCTVTCRQQLSEALDFARHHDLAVTVLGGGSNIVLAGDVAGLVIRLALAGIASQPLAQEGRVLVRAEGGVNWHQLVRHCLDRGWYGLENLALIPGCVGAAPIQNIGAYGVELADCFHGLEAIDLASGELLHMTAADCAFGYRDSIFKHTQKGKLAIVAVTLVLSTQSTVCLDYPELRAALVAGDGSDLTQVTPQQVFDAVCALRRAKLPDPLQRPNAGSFFKNPVIRSEQVATLRRRYPDLPSYRQADGCQKIPAAWLIDRAGWKGHRRGAVGVHDRQALVLVHFGGGSGGELLALADAIVTDVRARFAIDLEREPTLLGGVAAARESDSYAGSGH